MTVILIFFVTHWTASIFAQTFFLHRYSSHRMFTMSPGWERFWYLFSFVAQGPSFLVPRAYAILHREHHAFSDTPQDPHSPLYSQNAASMMWKTKHRYDGYAYRRTAPEARFEGGTPEWLALDRLSQSWITRIGLSVAYGLIYIAFAPSAWFFLLLPIHWVMGPLHGAIVNWGGHKYGYKNFDNGDESRNSLPIDVLTMGELFQNNHHKFSQSPNFAVRKFEVDPCYQVMKVMNWMGIINLGTNPQVARILPH
jgi:stearoyl-CoA desaturase (delta-9 desaturase)